MNNDKQIKVKKFQQTLKSFIKNEEWDKALIIFDELLDVRETAQRWCNRSFVLFQLGKIGEALEGYDKALRLRPGYDVALQGIEKAEELLCEIESEDEYEEFSSSLDVNEKEKILQQEFQKYVKEKNWSKALLVIQSLIAIQATMERLCNQGFLFVKQGSLQSALESYNNALQINSRSEIVKKNIQKVQKMIYEVREGTKEEKILAINFQETGPPKTLKVFIIAIIVFIIIVAIFQSNLFTSKELAVVVPDDSSKKISSAKEQNVFSDKFATEQKNKGLVLVEKKWITQKQKYVTEQEKKGLILINGNWLTPEEKFKLQQKKKGLLLVGERWMTAEEKFIGEQKEKGLLFVNNKWITLEEKFAIDQQAKGLILVKGKWLTTEEKFILEQEAEGLIKWDGKWLSKTELQNVQLSIEKKLPKKVQNYYEYLNKRSSKATEKNNFKNAYKYMQKSKSFLKFVGISSNLPLVKKIRSKLKMQKSYIFPLELYKQSKNMEYIFVPEKMNILNKKIRKLKKKYVAIIKKRNKEDDNMKILVDDVYNKQVEIKDIDKNIASFGKIKKEIRTLQQEIKNNAKKIQKNDRVIRKIKEKLLIVQEDFTRAKEEEIKIEEELSFLEKEISEKSDKQKKQNDNLRSLKKDIKDITIHISNTNEKEELVKLNRTLASLNTSLDDAKKSENIIADDLGDLKKKLRVKENEMNNKRRLSRELEREINSIQEEKEEKEKEKKLFANNMEQEKRDILSSKEKLQNVKEKLHIWKEQLILQKIKLRKLLVRQEKVIKTIAKYKLEIKPLVTLEKKKRDIPKVLGKFQRWWGNLQVNKKVFLRGKNKVERPLFNMLLSLYVLNNFSSKNIKVKINKHYRSLGVAKIYFR